MSVILHCVIILSGIMQRIIKLTGIMLSDIMVSVVLLSVITVCSNTECIFD